MALHIAPLHTIGILLGILLGIEYSHVKQSYCSVSSELAAFPRACKGSIGTQVAVLQVADHGD